MPEESSADGNTGHSNLPRPQIPRDNIDLQRFLEDEEKKLNSQITPHLRPSVGHSGTTFVEPGIPSRNSPLQTTNEEDPSGTCARQEAPSISSPYEVLSKRNVNGIWDPRHATDITVHLRMSVQEDLDEISEEFHRLGRLGDFTNARQFFVENLQDYLNRPKVLVEYMEMLFEQGDYRALSEVNDDMMRNVCGKHIDNGDMLTLTIYWELLRFLATYHKPERLGVLFARSNIASRALDHLRVVMDLAVNGITSTEIKILALLYHLHDFLDGKLHRLRDMLFPSGYHKALYTHLMGQGRIWDLRDISLARISSRFDITQDWSDDTNLRRRVRSLVEDWLNTASDTSTALALLDILTSFALRLLGDPRTNDDGIQCFLDEAAPLALSIMEIDLDCMKSRPFTKWMLAKAQFTEKKSSYYAGHKLSRPLPGIVRIRTQSQLPQYVPLDGETPCWNLNDSISELERPMRTALKISRALGDYRTEAMALQELILLSTSPEKEFEELCHLQKLIQGDTYNYSQTLISKYLICNTEEMKKDLKLEISGLFSIPDFPSCLSKQESWMLNMLQYSLKGKRPAAEHDLKETNKSYHDTFRRMADDKVWRMRQRMNQTNTKKNVEPKELDVKKERPKHR